MKNSLPYKAAQEAIKSATESLVLNYNDHELLQNIVNCALLIEKNKGRLITTGMGKSGLIARKAAATLTSTGTPAVFLHPADALHGDMGNIQENEVVLAFSNSGETRELLELLPHIKTLRGKLIAVTQKKESNLSKYSDGMLIYHVTKEGCPLELAPMASTTSALNVADALAAALIRIKNFEKKDFSRFHPSGALGKRLLTNIVDVMLPCENSQIYQEASFKDLIPVMVQSNLGAVAVVTKDLGLKGIISDGDMKRLLEKYNENPQELWKLSVKEIMIPNPKAITQDKIIEEALTLMHEEKIYTLPVLDNLNKIVGMLRMHDLVEFV